MSDERQVKEESLQILQRSSRKPASAIQASVTLFGFLLFLTGLLMFVIGTIEMFTPNDSLQTACYLFLGIVMYKIGRFILKQSATLPLKENRRKQVLS